MCYLYDTIHELFEAKELNVELFKEFYNKYSDNKDIIDAVIIAIKGRGWLTLDIKNMTNADIKITKFDNHGKFYPFSKKYKEISYIIKRDNTDEFIPIFNVNNSYTVNTVFIPMICYYGAVKCLKFILLYKDIDYMGNYLKNNYYNIKDNHSDPRYYYNLHKIIGRYNEIMYISTHNEIIKTIRNVIGFSEAFENILIVDSLRNLNFNVLKNVEYEFKMHSENNNNYDNNYNILTSNNTINICSNTHVALMTYMLYKDFNKREFYIVVDKYYDKLGIVKEYIDYLFEMYFDKDYDKELMRIVICEKSVCVSYNDNDNFFKKYNDVYLAGLMYCKNVDLKSNSIYNMLSQKSKDIIDIFVMFNEIYNGDAYTALLNDIKKYSKNSRTRPLKDLLIYNKSIETKVKIRNELNYIMKIINNMSCKYIKKVSYMKNSFNLRKYTDLYNSAFSEIL